VWQKALHLTKPAPGEPTQAEADKTARLDGNSLPLPGLAGSYHKRKKPQAPTPQAPVRNRQTRKVANAKFRIG